MGNYLNGQQIGKHVKLLSNNEVTANTYWTYEKE